MIKLLAFISFILSFNVMAAGGGGGGHITDLLIPALNFSIVFFGLVFLLRNPIRKKFEENAANVKELYTLAEEKDKEAQIKLEMFEKKIKAVEVDKEKILDDSKRQASEFENKIERETQEILDRLKKDNKSKAVYEKNQLIKELNEKLINQIIEETKQKIEGNPALQKQATEKLFSQLQ